MQHAKRSLGFLANAAARIGSSEASSIVCQRGQALASRWRLMTTAGLECGKSWEAGQQVVGGRSEA